MRKLTLKVAGLTAASLIMQSSAYANDKPIEILLNEVKLDLSNPDATAKRTIDKGFKSNHPAIRSRVYKLNDGTRVKLVGRNFDKASDIDKIKITYTKDGVSYKNAQAALTKSFGTPSTKRPDILVWRLSNTTQSSTQSKTLKVIAEVNTTEKSVITANRQRGGRGNNMRATAPSPKPIKNTSTSSLRSSEID